MKSGLLERYIRQYEHRIDSTHLKDSSKYLTKLLEKVNTGM
jgi:hypothetical protein